jgi:hypothetical protein
MATSALFCFLLATHNAAATFIPSRDGYDPRTLVGFSSQVVGAETDEEEADDVELEEVQVTGTRIQSPTCLPTCRQ